MADTIVSQETNELKTGDTEATLAWLDELRKNLSAEPTKKRPPAPDHNRAATANNARQAQATKRAKSQAAMTTDEWLKTLPQTGKQHFEQRYMMGGTGVSILIADGDITIYKHTNVRGVLDAMGLHKAPNHTEWFAVQTVEDFDAFCGYWMRVRAWAKYARVEKPETEEKPIPPAKPAYHVQHLTMSGRPRRRPTEVALAMRVWHREGDKYVPCQCFGWAGADLRICYPDAKEQTLIPAVKLVEMLSSGELRIEGVMPEMYKRVPAPPPENDGPKRAPAPVRPEVAELVEALEKAGLDKPHAKFGGSFNLPGGYQGYLYKTDWKVRNKRTGKSIAVGTVFTGLDRRDILVRELGKIVPVKRAASAA